MTEDERTRVPGILSALSLDALLRASALLGVGFFTIVILSLLLSPDSTQSRVVFGIVIVGLAWIGGVGAVTKRFQLSGIGAFGLVVLGFWQAALWIFMIPLAVLLGAVAAYDVDGDDQ